MRKHSILSQTLEYLALSIWSLTATLALATAAPVPPTTPPEEATAPTPSRTVPSDAAACIPTAQVIRTELLASSTYAEKTYYLIAAYNAGGFPSDLVISTHKDRCQRLFFNISGEKVPFPSNVPEPVARQFNSQRSNK